VTSGPPPPAQDAQPPDTGLLSRLLRGARSLLTRALSEHSRPGETALSVAFGAFCACTPFIGLHIWLALGLATLLRLNRVWAAVGSRATSVPLLLPLVVFVEVQLGHRVRAGAWLTLSPHEALSHGRELLGDWLLGALPVGAVFAGILGSAAYLVAVRRERVRLRTPSGSPPASSEWPPSGPPTLTP
jgi:uncharacterized protein (DUF2062 family)